MTKKFVAVWSDEKMNLVLARIFIETEFGAIKTVSIDDPESAVIHDLGVFLPYLTDNFECWKRIAISRAKEAKVMFRIRTETVKRGKSL